MICLALFLAANAGSVPVYAADEPSGQEEDKDVPSQPAPSATAGEPGPGPESKDGLVQQSVVATSEDKYIIAIGFFNNTFQASGFDIQVNYRPNMHPWMYGFRFRTGTDVYKDSYTGATLTETTETVIGPVAYYRLEPGDQVTVYVGVSLLYWAQEEVAPGTGERSTDAIIAPFFGGGYMGRFSKHGFFNAGVFVNPFTRVKTHTSVGTTVSSGDLDLQLQLGLSF